MTFLNASLAALLLPLLALPLVIHLLNKRFPQRLLFPSVELLRKTAAERSRIYRWRHRLLTLVRTLFLLLLLLVFLKPVLDRFGNASRPAGNRRVLLVVDASLSMEHQRGGLSARERARLEAAKILDLLRPGDAANVIAVRHTPSICFTAFSPDIAESRRFLGAIPPGIGRADFTQANIAAGRLLDEHPGETEVYYLSDFQRKNWARVDFAPVESRARLFFVDLADPDAANRAVLGAEIPPASVLAGDSVPLEVTVGNFSGATLRDTLTVRLDRQVELQQAVEAAPWSSTRVTIPLPATAPGTHVCEIRLPADALAVDDRWVLTLPVMEKEEIATLSAEPDPAADPVRFLHAALNPFPGQAGSLLPRHVASDRLDAAALASARKLFVTRAGPLDDDGAQVLARFLHRGGHVVWFLDGAHDPANLERLEKAAGAPLLPMRLGALRRAERVGTGAQQIATGEFKSRLLRLFRGPLRQDLGLLEFYDFHVAASTGAGKVLLRFGDETPAMAVAEHGLGTLVLMNFSVSEFSSNLARQRLFPAWIQDLVKQLDSSLPAPLAFVAGQVIEGEVWKEDLRRHPLLSPSGHTIEPRQEPNGQRARVRFPADELGFYSLAGSRGPTSWAVNADPDEADLRPVDRSQLPVGTDPGKGTAFMTGQSDYAHVAAGRPLLHWFLFAGLLVLGLEMALQLLFRRLAP